MGGSGMERRQVTDMEKFMRQDLQLGVECVMFLGLDLKWVLFI